jgi:hypothetical protein
VSRGVWRSVRPFGVVVCAAALLACGARSALLDDEALDGGASDGSDECLLPDAVRGVVGTGDATTCVLEGQSADGRTHRMECSVTDAADPREFAGCRWRTDGEVVCECHSPDWASTCPNSIPICVRWNRPFDFARDVEFER